MRFISVTFRLGCEGKSHNREAAVLCLALLTPRPLLRDNYLKFLVLSSYSHHYIALIAYTVFFFFLRKKIRLNLWVVRVLIKKQNLSRCEHQKRRERKKKKHHNFYIMQDTINKVKRWTIMERKYLQNITEVSTLNSETILKKKTVQWKITLSFSKNFTLCCRIFMCHF